MIVMTEGVEGRRHNISSLTVLSSRWPTIQVTHPTIDDPKHNETNKTEARVRAGPGDGDMVNNNWCTMYRTDDKCKDCDIIC